jgi:hypothetical protein
MELADADTVAENRSARQRGCWPRSRAWILVPAGSAKSSTLTLRARTCPPRPDRRPRAARGARASAQGARLASRTAAAVPMEPRARADAANTSIDARSSPTAARALIAPFRPESVRTAMSSITQRRARVVIAGYAALLVWHTLHGTAAPARTVAASAPTFCPGRRTIAIAIRPHRPAGPLRRPTASRGGRRCLLMVASNRGARNCGRPTRAFLLIASYA